MTTDKAKRETIFVGSLEIEGFMMPDGSYKMSQTQAAQAVEKDESNARKFLRSKGAKSLIGEDYTPGRKSQIEVEATRFTPLELREVSAFWLWESHRGNKKALALCHALMMETLERRFDDAFGVERTEGERQARLTERMDISRTEFEALAESMAEPDILREHISRLEDQVRRLGEEPLQSPPLEED